MKYKYAVFDWDGTLADTYPVISAAYDYTFDKMGLLRIPYDEIKRITSTLQNKDTLGYVFKERRDEAAGYFYEYIEKFHTDRLAPMFGAEKLLGFCREKGLECYLITNKKRALSKKNWKSSGSANILKKWWRPANMRKTSRIPWPVTRCLTTGCRRPAKSWSSATAKPTSKPRRLLSMTANGPNASFTIPNANTAVPNRTIR